MKIPRLQRAFRRLPAGFLAVLLLIGPAAGPSHADEMSPPSLVLVNRNPNGHAGDWWRGALPSGADPQKPVLVFVPGLHDEAGNWWQRTVYSGVNDMYAYAYAHGYRTAFVDLGDADGTGQSMWTNGDILAGQLSDIADYYGVSKVNVIAHSKGGIDVNTAVAFYGADAQVGRVFTLSSPHEGSPLADLAYSWWAGWLAELLGERDSGVYVLQTGYMNWFRSVADDQSADRHVSYFTEDGTNWGPAFSALWFGGLYLSGSGRSDGAVPVSRATKPGAVHLATTGFNHDNIRIGHNIWSTFSGYVGSLATSTTAISEPTLPVDSPDQGMILRGGQIDGVVGTTFPVESGATSLSVDLLTAGATPAVLVDPAGGRWPLTAGRGGEEIFRQAVSQGLQIDSPLAGTWHLEMQGNSGAYLAIIRPHSDLTVQVGLPEGPQAAGSGMRVQVQLGGRAKGVKPMLSLHAGQTALAAGTSWGRPVQAITGRPGMVQSSVTLPGNAGVLNVSGTVTGVLPDGSSFERSFVRSVGVAPAGASSVESLRSLTRP